MPKPFHLAWFLPVIAQAGGSPRGKQFAARFADTIVASVKGTEAMRAYRDDIRRLVRTAYGHRQFRDNLLAF